jgi:hypothetical protein
MRKSTDFGIGNVSGIRLPGLEGGLELSQDNGGLKIILPAGRSCDYVYSLKITRLNLK